MDQEDDSMTKRLFAWVLVLAMILSLMPGITLGVSAEEKPWEHTGHDGWTEWTDATKLPTAAGKYYLSVDVNLDGDWTVTKDIELCLGGHTITQTKSGARVAILSEGKNSTLSIYDCVGTGKVTGGTNSTGSAFNVGRTTTLNWYGGTITGNTNTSLGTVYIQKATSAGKGGTFNMYDGEISGNKVKNGIIYGAGGDEGYVGSQINIYGGEIKNNTATGSGAGIYVTGRGKVHIENATFTGNTASTAGSAIYAEGADHPIYIKNTTITGNTGTSTNATGYSAAVYTCGAGTHLTLSGKVVISGNTTGVAGLANVVMQSSYSDVLYVDELSAGSDVTFKTNKVTATAATEVIAVSAAGTQKGLWQSEWITYQDATGANKHLTYGKDGFYFVEGHYHGDQKYVAWTDGDSLPQTDVDGVGYYLDTDVAMSSFAGDNIANVTGGKVLHLCMNGKTLSRSGTKTGSPFEIKDGKLYISDCTTIYDEDGLFVSGGKITGFAKKGNGAAMYIYNAASVVEIQGVEFVNNTTTETNLAYGGTIQIRNGVTEPVKIVGCKFTDNISSGGSGAIAVRNSSKLVVEKTIFTGNQADTAAVIYTDAGDIIFKDCKITGNTARNASVVNVLGNTSRVTFENTQVTGNNNTGTTGYGAINCANSAAVVKFTGKTVVYDNVNKDGKQANLFLQNYAGVVYDVTELTEGAKVGVSMIAERIASGYLYFSTAMTGNPGYCVSDDENYTVALDDQNRLALVAAVSDGHKHGVCGASCADHADVIFEAWDKTDSLPTAGNYYLVSDVTVAELTTTTGNLTLCLNGKTITQTATARVLMAEQDHVLTITDCGTTGTITGGKDDYGSVVRVQEGATFNL